MARLAGVNRSQVNRWSRGENRPGYDPVRSLAAAVWRKHPDLARELVEASGYAWAEPKDPPPPDVLTEELGQDTADRVRRELAKRGEAGRAVLAEFERVLSSPGEEAESEPGRAVS
jgi:transcriptional regulator with XRE-family HTH domain